MTVPALQRGIDILHYVKEHPGCLIGEIQESLDIPRASLDRMITCLLENDFLECRQVRKRYWLGLEMIAMSMAFHESDTVTRQLKPVLKRLVGKWDVTFVVYEYRHPFQLIWRVKEEAPGGIRTRHIGFQTDRLNYNAQGQLFLSQLTDKEITNYLIEKGEKKTEHSLVEPEAFMGRVEEIRRQGYAYQERENNLSSKQIAAPLDLPGLEATLCLGCFLTVDFGPVDALRDDMLIACGRLSSQE